MYLYVRLPRVYVYYIAVLRVLLVYVWKSRQVRRAVRTTASHRSRDNYVIDHYRCLLMQVRQSATACGGSLRRMISVRNWT